MKYAVRAPKKQRFITQTSWWRHGDLSRDFVSVTSFGYPENDVRWCHSDVTWRELLDWLVWCLPQWKIARWIFFDYVDRSQFDIESIIFWSQNRWNIDVDIDSISIRYWLDDLFLTGHSARISCFRRQRFYHNFSLGRAHCAIRNVGLVNAMTQPACVQDRKCKRAQLLRVGGGSRWWVPGELFWDGILEIANVSSTSYKSFPLTPGGRQGASHCFARHP